MPRPTKLYLKDETFSDLPSDKLFLPSDSLQVQEAPLVWLPTITMSASSTLPSDGENVSELLRGWGVRPINDVISGFTITPQGVIDPAEDEEVQANLTNEFSRALLEIVAFFLDPANGIIKCKLAKQQHEELARHLRSLAQKEYPFYIATSIVKSYVIKPDADVLLVPSNQTAWWDIASSAMYLGLKPTEKGEWKHLDDRILNTILAHFNIPHLDKRSFHDFVLSCKLKKLSLEEAIERYKHKEETEGISINNLPMHAAPIEMLMAFGHQSTTLTHHPDVASSELGGALSSSSSHTNNYTWDPKELIEESASFSAPMAATDAGIGSICLFLDSAVEGSRLEGKEPHSEKSEKEKGTEVALRFGGGYESSHAGSRYPRRRQSYGGNSVQLPGRDAASSPSRVSASSSSYLNGASLIARENNDKQEVGNWGEEYVHSVVLPHLFSQWLGELSKPRTITGQGVSLEYSNDKYRLVLSWMRGQNLPYDILVEVYDLTKQQQQPPMSYYIEAKTTSGTSKQFYLTYNQCQLAYQHGQYYWIIRVTGASTTTPQVAVFVDPVRLFHLQLHQQLKMTAIVVDY